MIADVRQVWIMRELSAGPLLAGELEERMQGTVAHSSLEKRLRSLARIGVLRREERGGRSAGVPHHLEDLGRALLVLADRTLAWEHRVNPAAAPLVLASGSPALRALAGPHTGELVTELAAAPASLAALQRALAPLSRSQVEGRVNLIVQAGFVDRRESGYVLVDAGRQTGAYMALAARVEQRHGLAGAGIPRAADMARLLEVTIPLVDPGGRSARKVEIEVEEDSGEPAGRRRLEIAVGGRLSDRFHLLRGRVAVAASVRGTLDRWCAALLDGDDAGLRLGGDAALARRLVRGLHGRMFG